MSAGVDDFDFTGFRGYGVTVVDVAWENDGYISKLVESHDVVRMFMGDKNAAKFDLICC